MDTAQERDRLVALHDLALLDTPAEERFDRIVRLAQQIFDVPIAAVNLVDADRLFTKSAIGLPVGGDIPRSVGFCARTIETDDALVVPDLGLDRRFVDNPLVSADPHMRFYAGQPLAAPGGHRVGTLCLLDDRPRDLTPGQTAVLRDLADLVEKELASDEELNQAREVQTRLLPRSAPDVPGYDVAGRCVPARHIGGDFFDWYPHEDTFQFVVADDTWALSQEHLDQGDTLLLVSDGILDFFPTPEAAVDAAVALCRRIHDAAEMVAEITGIGAGHTVADDITALVVHRY